MDIIRKAEKRDWKQIEAIYRESIEAGLSTFRREVPSYEDWNDTMDDECRFVFISDGKVAAFTVMAPFSVIPAYSGVAETSIYVDSSFRGMGIGTRLLKTMITESGKRGFWSLYAKVISENEASIALHRKCGYRIVGYRENIARDIHGNWRNIIELERRTDISEVR